MPTDKSVAFFAFSVDKTPFSLYSSPPARALYAALSRLHPFCLPSHPPRGVRGVTGELA